MATRLSADLGLHLDISNHISNGLLTERDMKIRQTAFWGVFIHEQYASPAYSYKTLLTFVPVCGIYTLADHGDWGFKTLQSQCQRLRQAIATVKNGSLTHLLSGRQMTRRILFYSPLALAQQPMSNSASTCGRSTPLCKTSSLPASRVQELIWSSDMLDGRWG